MYRVSYGNGQVSATKNLQECLDEVKSHRAANVEFSGTFYVQRYMGAGDWTRSRKQVEAL